MIQTPNLIQPKLIHKGKLPILVSGETYLENIADAENEMKINKSLFSAKNTGKISRKKNKNAVIRVMQSSVRLLHKPVHRVRNDSTLLRGAQPEESSSFSNTEQLLQIGIFHFKHVYFVVLKHELYMSSSLEPGLKRGELTSGLLSFRDAICDSH